MLLVDEAVDWVTDELVGGDEEGAHQDHARSNLGVEGEHERLNMIVVEGKVLLHRLEQAAYRHFVQTLLLNASS